MKRSFLILFISLLSFSSIAQDRLHYQFFLDYVSALPGRDICINPRKIDLPAVNGYNAYTADLHIHTVYSDGNVTPQMRVYEAYLEGLDILAITDHQPTSRPEMLSKDMNRAHELAQQAAEGLDIKLIKGFEIGGYDPIGHINVIFTTDCNAYDLGSKVTTEDCDRMFRIAKSQDAVVFANHPGWPDQDSSLSDYLITNIENGTITGIEIFNDREFYPLAIDHANKYGICPLANTDSHNPMALSFDVRNGHRPMNIIFAKDKSDEALKDALRNGRTLAWSNDILCGDEYLLMAFLKSSIDVVFFREWEGGNVHFRLYNKSSIPFRLSAENVSKDIYIPALSYAECIMRKPLLDSFYSVSNMYCGSDSHPSFSLRFLLGQSVVPQPYISRESIVMGEDGLRMKFAPSKADIYYTTDGSNPDTSSKLYKGEEIIVKKSYALKAVSCIDGIVSDVYCFNTPMDMALEAAQINQLYGRKGVKNIKHGVSFNFYENADILSTKSVDTLGSATTSGVKKNFDILEGIDKDHFAFEFTGVLKVEENGLYEFILLTNDGADLYIGEALACDNDQHRGLQTANGSIYLQKGLHKYRIRYFEGYGGESFSLKWIKPGSKVAQEIPDENLYL